MKVRVVYRPDDSVAVIRPVPSSRGAKESVEDWYTRVCEKAMRAGGFEGYDFDDIDDSLLPSREARDAWRKKTGGGVEVDQTAKDDIVRKKLIDSRATEEKESQARKAAIKALKSEGKLPANYTE